MRCSASRWFGLLLTLFLVLVLPSCWYGTLQRALVTSDIPANSNEEERHEHGDDVRTPDEASRRTSSPPAKEQARTAGSPPRTPAPPRVRVASVADPVHPSLYSVRRLR